MKRLFQGKVEIELFEKHFYIHDLPKGIYMLVIKTIDGIHTKKIIKQ